MKTKYFFLYFLILPIISCNNNEPKGRPPVINKQENRIDTKPRIKFGDECAVIETILSKVRKEEKLDTVAVLYEYIKWDEDLNFDFKVNGNDWLPKTKKERLARLKSNSLFDPYPILYLFAFPVTDTLFKNEDRSFMRTQIADTSEFMICDFVYVKNANKKERVRNRVAFTKPLFSKDGKRAALQLYFDYDYVNGIFGGGILQNIFLRKEENEWKIVFETGKWLL